MSLYSVRPAFGAPRKSLRYYEDCSAIIRTLRPIASLKIIAQHLQSAGLRTPLDGDWTRQSVANFVRAHNL